MNKSIVLATAFTTFLLGTVQPSEAQQTNPKSKTQQQKPEPKASPTKPRIIDGDLDIKDAAIGDTIEKIKTDFNADCLKDSCSAYFMSSGKKAIPEDKKSIGNITARMYLFSFENGILVEASIAFHPNGFSGVYEALTYKYGKPSTEFETTVQNRMGAEFQDKTAIWSSQQQRITLYKYAGDINSSALILQSIERADRQKRERDQNLKKPGAV